MCDDHVNMVPASGPFRQMGTVPFFRVQRFICSTFAGGKPLNHVEEAWL